MRSKAWTVGVLCALLAATAWAQGRTPPPRPATVVVDDFEAGVRHWTANDDQATVSHPAKKCAIYAMSGGAPAGGKRSARIEFERSPSGWASLSTRVDGRKWAQAGCSRLSMWIRGDGSAEPLRVTIGLQTTNPPRDVAYSQVIRLDGTTWEKFSFRFFGFTDSTGAALQAGDLPHITLLQFSKNGAWSKFRFRLDEVMAEAEPKPAQATPAPRPPVTTPVPTPPPTHPGAKTARLSPDLGRPGVPARLQIGLNLGSPPTVLDGKDDDAGSWAEAVISDLGPCVVRLQLSDYFDPRHESYDLDLLRRHMAWVERCSCRPLVCLNVPRAVEDKPAQRERLYALFVRTVTDLVATAAKTGTGNYYEIFSAPLTSGAFADVEHVVSAYNKLTDLVLAADPAARVGGPGLASAGDQHVAGFLKGARRLDFLSFHFYGTHSVLAESDALYRTANDTRSADLPHQLSFQQVRRLAKSVRGRDTEVFVTRCALSSARDDQGWCRDERASTGFGAAWLATVVLAGTPYVDKLIHYKLAPGGWGMISHSGVPETPYWAAWLLAHYAPRGSMQLEVMRPSDLVVAATFKTKTAYNLVIAYAGVEPLELRVAPKHLPPLSEVRERHVAESDHQWKGNVLPTGPMQTVYVESPGVVVLQYVPQK